MKIKQSLKKNIKFIISFLKKLSKKIKKYYYIIIPICLIIIAIIAFFTYKRTENFKIGSDDLKLCMKTLNPTNPDKEKEKCNKFIDLMKNKNFEMLPPQLREAAKTIDEKDIQCIRNSLKKVIVKKTLPGKHVEETLPGKHAEETLTTEGFEGAAEKIVQEEGDSTTIMRRQQRLSQKLMKIATTCVAEKAVRMREKNIVLSKKNIGLSKKNTDLLTNLEKKKENDNTSIALLKRNLENEKKKWFYQRF